MYVTTSDSTWLPRTWQCHKNSPHILSLWWRGVLSRAKYMDDDNLVIKYLWAYCVIWLFIRWHNIGGLLYKASWPNVVGSHNLLTWGPLGICHCLLYTGLACVAHPCSGEFEWAFLPHLVHHGGVMGWDKWGAWSGDGWQDDAWLHSPPSWLIPPPIGAKLFLVGSAMQPVVPHVHGFGASGLTSVGDNS